MKIIIIAGIVLFNPSLNRLTDNINAILHQVELLLLIDNGSNNFSQINFLNKNEKIIIIRNNNNKGIAYALNQILGYAYSHGYDWVLTLDQDSVVSPNIIDEYEKITDEKIGIIGCNIIDRNHFQDNYKEAGVEETSWVISSASYTNTKAWKDVGGFDTKMFIDWVDLDYCTLLKKKGFHIILNHNTHILHELGINTRIISIRGHIVYLSNRPAKRYYYIFRNYIYLSHKYPDIFPLKEQLKQSFYSIIGIIIYEKHKISNFFSFCTGTFWGLFMKVSKQ